MERHEREIEEVWKVAVENYNNNIRKRSTRKTQTERQRRERCVKILRDLGRELPALTMETSCECFLQRTFNHVRQWKLNCILLKLVFKGKLSELECKYFVSAEGYEIEKAIGRIKMEYSNLPKIYYKNLSSLKHKWNCWNKSRSMPVFKKRPPGKCRRK
ncbi:hypothetical protein ACOME3_004293 [Neoechinorhynchus agilis]